MILYGSSLSPYTRKVLAFAGEKSIEIELQPTGFPNFRAEFLAASPFRKMPALSDGDYNLADSSAIIHYMEAKYPDPALIPRDPALRGKAAELNDLPPILDYLETVVPEGDGYLVGESLTIADIAVASPFANFRYTRTRIDPDRYPRIVAYTDRILARPSFAHWLEREATMLAKEPA